jgi:hypothetical protein
MHFIELPTNTGTIWININHIIFIRAKPRCPGQSLIEITNPTPDEIGYLTVNVDPETVVHLISYRSSNEG